MFKIKNLKKILIPALVLTLSLTLNGCGKNTAADSQKNSSGNTQNTGELKTVKIATPGQGGVLIENALLAQKLGYIDEELKAAGYKAEYMGFAQAGPAINEAFAAGEIDFAVYNELPAMMAKSNGIDIKIISTVTQDYNYAVIANKDSGITSAKDLSGKKVIATTGTILYKYFADICRENNIDISSVELVNAQADANSVLASGQADAYVTAYSAALQLEEAGTGSIIEDTTGNADERTGIILAARQESLSSGPDAAAALVKALKKAADFAQKNPDDVYGYLKTDNYTEDTLKKIYSYDTSFSYFEPAFTDIYKSHLENQYEFAKENKLLGGDVDLNAFLDNTYLDQVNK
ncbi:MAG: ABC transporter substrate-binding protein [Lachnospiraceae bacterium]|nr:ABC transporter substrate-binding protein [Lachnospiraceae bacterium]